MRHFIIAILMLLYGFALIGQNRVVNGYVTTLGNLHVANLKVSARNAGSAVSTDSTGFFFIVTNERDVLEFSSDVFKKRRVRINNRLPDTLMVAIEFVDSPENRQIAVGYGYMNEKDIINSISQMDRKRNDFCQYSNVFDLIRGRFPGVQVVGGGREPEVIIRGISSINLSSCALYVLDGVVVNAIGHISPCQISSISVLKDSSASMYGSRGANGVVVIETIKGPQ